MAAARVVVGAVVTGCVVTASYVMTGETEAACAMALVVVVTAVCISVVVLLTCGAEELANAEDAIVVAEDEAAAFADAFVFTEAEDTVVCVSDWAVSVCS